MRPIPKKLIQHNDIHRIYDEQIYIKCKSVHRMNHNNSQGKHCIKEGFLII